ncbi:MAG: hypothetical protein AB7F50_10690 [Fimbriimonadaceae bacterium]
MTLAAALILAPAFADWEVNEHRTLLFGGTPWIPVGVEVDGSQSQIESAVASGITDLLVSVQSDATGWSETQTALDAAKANYALRPIEEWPRAEAWVVAPQHIRRDSPTEANLVVSVPGATEVLAVLAKNRDRGIALHAVVSGEGSFVIQLGREAGADRTLLLYPRMKESEIPDLAERFDARRDRLYRSLKAHPFGAGLRAIVSPMGQEPSGYSEQFHAKEAGNTHVGDFAAFLESKYQSMSAVTRAWSIASNDLNDFTMVARLVPLWSAGRGVASLFDPVQSKLYAANDATSRAWDDIEEFRELQRTQRLGALVAGVRRLTGVPVFTGQGESEATGEDGVALTVSAGNLAQLLDSTGLELGLAMKGRKRTLWAMGVSASHLGVDEIWSELLASGFRGAFFRSGDPTDLPKIALAARTTEPDAAQWSLHALPFPSQMLGSVFVSRTGGNTLWLPSAGSGTPIPYWANIRGYRLLGQSEARMVIWREGQPERVKMRCSDPKTVTVKAMDGTEIPLRKGRHTIEFELGGSPVMVSGNDRLPASEDAIAEVTEVLTRILDRYGAWVDVAGSEKLNLRAALEAIDLDPLGSLEMLDRHARRLTVSCAPYAWISLDRVEDGPLATGIVHEGASLGRAGSAAAGWPGQASTPWSSWSFSCKAEGDFEAWLATNADDETLPTLQLTVGGATMRPIGPAVSLYGGGFRWVPFGLAKLASGTVVVKLSCSSERKTEFLLDALVLAPSGFRADGPRPPVAFLRD